MTKEKKNTEEKPKRRPALILGTVMNDNGTIEEMEFEGKVAVRKFIEEECKGKFKRVAQLSGVWVDLKEGGGKIRFTIKPEYFAMATVTRYQECSADSIK